MSLYVFPFEKVKKGSNLVFYGAGVVGSDLLNTLKLTDYCNVVAVIDRDKTGEKVCGYQILAPESITGLNSEHYDVVFVAISSKKRLAAVAEFLNSCKVPIEKTIFFDGSRVSRATRSECLITPDNGGSVFRLAIVHEGGLGDVMFMLPLILGLRKAVPFGLIIDNYVKYGANILRNVPFIDGVYPRTAYVDSDEYDAVLTGHWLPFPTRFSSEKAKRFSVVLHKYIKDLLWQFDEVFNQEYRALNLLLYGKLIGKKRIELNNLRNILPFDRHTLPYIEVKPESFGFLHKVGLHEKPFITICEKVNEDYPKSLKMWPREYFSKLMCLIKKRYPHYSLVRVGNYGEEGEVESIDLDLCKKTTMDEVCALLKHSTLHIGNEGGLINLKHGLSGCSVCLFGPTTPDIYAFEENINLRSNMPYTCSNGCYGIQKNWGYGGCLMDYNADYALCMKALTPEYVFEHIEAYLDSIQQLAYMQYGIIAPQEISALIENDCNAVLIYRDGDQYMLPLVDRFNCLTVIDRDLSEKPIMETAPINLGYWQRMQSIGVESEYGTLYNIPSADAQYDLTVNFTMPNEEHPEFALREMARITKTDGTVAAMTISGELALYRITRFSANNAL